VSPSRPIASVVLVGRDGELGLAAAVLAHALRPAGVALTAVELPSRLTPGDIHATLPPLGTLHARLGVAPGELLRATGGSLSLGQHFVLAAPRPRTFFHAWGAFGRPIAGHEFLHCWLRAGAAGLGVALQGFSPAAVVALNGRMLADDAQFDGFGEVGRGCHLPAAAYAACLKSLAIRRGVAFRQAARLDVECDSRGDVAGVVVDGSERVTGELFVDASGEDAVIASGALGRPWLPWPLAFGADRVLSALAPAFTATPPFAEIRTGASGWTALHPTPSATGVVHAFRGELTSDVQAAEAASAAAGAALTQVAVRPLRPGTRRETWAGNCVAIGSAAARLDPLHDLDLHVLQPGIVELISLFPAGNGFAAERAEYNRAVRSHLERLRDFQHAFYALAPCAGAFWRDAAHRPLSKTLEHTLTTFRASAYLPPHEDETLLPDSWHACLLGLGIRPERWPPATDRIPAPRLRAEIESMLASIRAKALEQPTHDACLQAIRQGLRPTATRLTHHHRTPAP
jgi:tryptophan halogenase